MIQVADLIVSQHIGLTLVFIKIDYDFDYDMRY